MSGGCVRCRPGRTSEVSGVWRCCRAPLSRPVLATVPAWEAFPEVNRVYATFFGGVPPARSTVQVAGLPLGARVEIELIALQSD